MNLPSLATVDDLQVRLGGIDIPDESQAQWLLDYASARLRARTGKTFVVGDVLDVSDLVRTICVEMVFRAVTNPAGVTQDTSGPFSVSFGPEAAQRIYLSGQEKEDLGLTAGRSKLWTQATTRGDLETDTVFVASDPGVDLIPYLANPAY